MKKIILILFSLLLVSCGVGYEYAAVYYTPIKVIKINNEYKIKYFSYETNRKQVIFANEQEYNDLTENGKKDIFSSYKFLTEKVKVDYD